MLRKFHEIWTCGYILIYQSMQRDPKT